MSRARVSDSVKGWFAERRLLRAAAGAAVLALALFHLRLLWQRLSDQSVLEPAVAAKWLASGLLLVGLWRLRASGLRLMSGKRAGVFWLLVLLLHVQLPMAPVSEAPLTTDLERVGWLLVLPAGVSASVALLGVFGLGLAALTASNALRPRPARAPRALRLCSPVIGVLPALSSRPPPLPF